jgi:peptidoglycan/xylan/chitin deacetylase (PgdA/CDA1 family)
MYHSVAPYTADPHRITVAPDRFERQLRWLRDRGLRGASMAELLAGKRDPRLVGLTFDDGYADFASHVLPVLRRYGFGATVFVIAGSLGGENTWDDPAPRKALLSADQVRAVAAAGIEIGSHSLSHQRMPALSERSLRAEVRDSRDRLADLLGAQVNGFCYPYGAAGPREVAAVEAAGYGYACAVGPSTVDGRFAVPRTYIGDRDTPVRLRAKRLRHAIRHRTVHSGGSR